MLQGLPVHFFYAIARARLQFLRRPLVDALNHRQFVHFNIGDLFQAREALRHQKLGKELIKIQGLHEQLGALVEFRLAALSLVLFRQDVDVEARQLACQAHVLAAAANGLGKLVLRHHDFNALRLLIEHDLADLRRLQRIHKECRRILVPRNDIDLLPLELVDDRLHPAAAHSHASPDWIYRRIVGNNGYLRPTAGIPGHRLDFYDAVVDFRHFHLEKRGHELRRRAGQEYLGSPGFAPHILDVAPDPVVRLIALAADLLVPAKNRLSAAHIHNNVSVFLALDDAVDDSAGPVLELLVLPIALGFADLLQNHLLGRLGRDAAHIDRRHLVRDGIADLGIIEVLLRLLHGQFGLVVLNRIVLDNRAHASERRLAGLAVDLDSDVHFNAVVGLGRAGQAFLHRFDHQSGFDHLLPRHCLRGLQKLKLVCRCDCHFNSPRTPFASLLRFRFLALAPPRPFAGAAFP